MPTSPRISMAFTLCALLGAACTPIMPPIPGKDGGVDAGFTVEPTLEDIQKKILTPGCAVASCHAGMNPQSGLDLTNTHSHDELVNKVSVYANTDAGLILVVPGHPEQSFLMDKLEKTDMQLAGRGKHMPDRNPKLNDVAIEAIRQWIQDGALNN